MSATLQRDCRHRDDAVSGHRGVAVVMHEQHARVRSGRNRLGEEGAAHVGMPARLEHQRAAPMVGVTRQPVALLEHRPAAWGGKAVDDEPERPARGVRVDGADHMAGRGGKGWKAGAGDGKTFLPFLPVLLPYLACSAASSFSCSAIQPSKSVWLWMVTKPRIR